MEKNGMTTEDMLDGIDEILKTETGKEFKEQKTKYEVMDGCGTC